jgi:hypothetical protein
MVPASTYPFLGELTSKRTPTMAVQRSFVPIVRRPGIRRATVYYDGRDPDHFLPGGPYDIYGELCLPCELASCREGLVWC